MNTLPCLAWLSLCSQRNSFYSPKICGIDDAIYTPFYCGWFLCDLLKHPAYKKSKFHLFPLCQIEHQLHYVVIGLYFSLASGNSQLRLMTSYKGFWILFNAGSDLSWHPRRHAPRELLTSSTREARR